jgi:hypothetical protein
MITTQPNRIEASHCPVCGVVFVKEEKLDQLLEGLYRYYIIYIHTFGLYPGSTTNFSP